MSDLGDFWGYPGADFGGAVYAQRTATDASGKAARAEADVAALELRMERMALACEAMWEIVRDRLGVTSDDLRRKMEEVDLRDGKLDGRLRRTAVKCGQCGRSVASDRRRCLWCGTDLAPRSAMM